MRALLAICLLAAASGAAAADPFQRRVPDHVLDSVRGGFTPLGGGVLTIAVDVQRTTPVVVQNGADGRALQTLTTVDVRTNALRSFNGIALQHSIGAAIAHSLQR